MNIIKTDIEGLLILEPKVFGDSRGYFFESWNKARYEEVGISCEFVQDNESKSSFGVLRGLHWQAMPYTQAKLVRVISGAVLDVAVDIRKGSPTYGKHVAIELSEENKRQFLVPRGFAHGFLVLSDEAEFCYKCDDFYHPEDEGGLAWNDPEIGVVWPGVVGEYPGNASAEGYTLDSVPLKLAERDQNWSGIRETFRF